MLNKVLFSSRQLPRLGYGISKPHIHRCATADRSTVRDSTRQLLDSFWESRGVLDPVHRKRLVDAAEALDAEGIHPLNSTPLATDLPLPGLPASWQLVESTPEVLAASRRLLALQQMLGGGLEVSGSSSSAGINSSSSTSNRAVDVVWMVVREPGLLAADLTQVTGRLLEMKIATYGTDVDVLKVVEAQPALLLSDRWRLDLESLPAAGEDQALSGAASAAPRHEGGGQPEPHSLSGRMPPMPVPEPGSKVADSRLNVSTEQSTLSSDSAALSPLGNGGGTADPVQQLVQAWQYGLASDGEPEWASCLERLGKYRARHGDTCVGFRDGDDPELTRWATKQRADKRRGYLAPGRLEQLNALGFHFDADEAEWCRWFSELLEFKRLTGHASPMPLVTGCDMYLINWCSVQRIARRSRVLSESRIQRLDEAGFDWTGADPLS